MQYNMTHTPKMIGLFMARFVPYNSTDDADLLTPSKLKSLLYFAQGLALVDLGRPLFDEDFRRGQNEYCPLLLPSIDSLYANVNGPIPDEDADGSCLDNDEIHLLAWAYDTFGCYTPVALKQMALESYPVRSVHPGWIIPKRTMKSYFRNEYFNGKGERK